MCVVYCSCQKECVNITIQNLAIKNIYIHWIVSLGILFKAYFLKNFFCHSQQQLQLLLGRGTSAESKMPNVFIIKAQMPKYFVHIK